MKSILKTSLLVVSICVALPRVGFAQSPPPNDNYSNSITLSGNDLTFSGTLAGATIESAGNYIETNAYQGYGPIKGSVWWNWIAPSNTTLTLEMVSTSIEVPSNPLSDLLIVYSATNGITMPTGLVLPALGLANLDYRLSPVTLSVHVTAGKKYQIQLIGYSSASCSFHLYATNAPVIVTQPRSQTVYSNASVLFSVLAADVNPDNLVYQWSFNGTNLPDQNSSMLAVTNIQGDTAGQYLVAISNASGFTFSQPATLSVSQSNFPISLSALGIVSNRLNFSLAGETGRLYRIQSSSDLVHWASEVSFPIGPGLPNTTSVIYNSCATVALSVPCNTARKFLRAMPYVATDPTAEVCINHLREVRAAKVI